jgi:signal transduction histidine kinase
MIRAAKDWIKARWPRLPLRTILFATLFTVAALPGFAAMFLRVYENTLVRQTEAELVAQGAALAAAAASGWPGAAAGPLPDPRDVHPELPTIDLSSTPIFEERRRPWPISMPPDPAAVAAARALAPVAARTQQVTLSSIVMLDRQGLIAGESRVAGQGRSLAMLPEVRAALSGTPRTVLRRNAAYRAGFDLEWLSRAAGLRVHHARPIVVEGRVVGVLLLARPARALVKGLYADRGKIAFGVAVIFGMLVVLSGVLSRGIVRPVEALARASRALASGRQEDIPDPPPTAAAEIQDLYADFARMAEAIERRSRYLRDFAHAVSHEFKTPLSGIRGTLEILGDHGASMAPEERRRFLANADADAARLSMLTARLLELARADLAGADPAARADLAAVLRRRADACAPDFSVVADLPEDCPPLALPEASLDAIAGALIDNARAAGAGRITFTARAEARAGLLRIAAEDNGPGIAAADRARIFEPFFTTRRASGGSGLGLPIVLSLVAAAGGALRLDEAGGAGETGARFVLELTIAGRGDADRV